MKFKYLTLEEKLMYITYVTGKLTIGFITMFIIACLN